MDNKERAALKTKIIETTAKTKEKIEQLVAATQPISPENAIGRISRMDAINNKSVAEAALRTARRKLSSLEVALHKVDHEDFGNCTRCRKPIQAARLMFMPDSDRCIRCADRP